MLRKHSKHTYATLKLIQMRKEDNQKWPKIQNPMLHAAYGRANGNLCFLLLGECIQHDWTNEKHTKKDQSCDFYHFKSW